VPPGHIRRSPADDDEIETVHSDLSVLGFSVDDRCRLRHLRDRTVRGGDKHRPSGEFSVLGVAALSTELAGAVRLFVPPVQRRV
jgi:hypothetical protein